MRDSRGDYTVRYNSRSHLSVIFQRHGSVWPRVLPYCIFNVLSTLLCRFCVYPRMAARGMTVSGAEHATSNFIVSFFVVSRCSMALARNDSARQNMFRMAQSTREIVSSITVATRRDQSMSAKAWRNRVSYYACLLLRLSAAAVDHEGEGSPAPWAVPELRGDVRERLRRYNQVTGDTGKYAHKTRNLREEICRAPITMAYLLRTALADNETELVDAGPCRQETMTRLNELVDRYMEGYLGQIRLIAFPLPFILLQMARTLMFVWVLTLPLKVQADVLGSLFPQCLSVFFLTYAFLGLEVLSIQLENPFGNDASDLDTLGVAEVIFEDIYAMLDMADGADWAQKLRENMAGGDEDKMIIPTSTEKDPLMIT